MLYCTVHVSNWVYKYIIGLCKKKCIYQELVVHLSGVHSIEPSIFIVNYHSYVP